jgi:hypothetical protein
MAKKGRRKANRSEESGGSQPTFRVRELQDIRALLILLLVKLDTPTNEIGAAMGISGQRVRQLVPSSKIEKFDFLDPDE